MTRKLLLHSSSHPTIDYTAQEESSFQENLLNHYIGVYDPDNGNLKLVPACGVTVRRTLRQHAADGLNEGREYPSQNVHPLALFLPLTISNYILKPSPPVSLSSLRSWSSIWDQEIPESHTLPHRKCDKSHSRQIRAGVTSHN